MQLESIRNIVIAGEAGVGKSSLINLITGEARAAVGNDVRGVTVETEYHDWVTDTQIFRLWDTPGLSEGSFGSVSPKRAQDVLRSLLTELGRGGGVHLVVICMRGLPRVTKGMKQTYDTIVRIRDKVALDVPLVAVITDLEKISAWPNIIPSMDEWWTTNAAMLSGFDMVFSDHACITTLPDNCHPKLPGRYELCQKLVRSRIIQSVPPQLAHNIVIPGRHEFSQKLVPSLDVKQSVHSCTLPPKDLHILLFGETGVGKSSLINLLAGKQVALVSPDSAPCTMDSSEYRFPFGSITIRLWDTVGLEEPEKGSGTSCVGAIEKAVQLIRRLNAMGGISLFLFCIRGNRITATIQSNYRLFYEVLGKKEVPIALAVTHLERETDMEEWWQRNTKMLEKAGIHSAGHACITTLDGHPKYPGSRDILQRLLSHFDDQGKFSMPPEAWIGRFLKGLSSLVDRSVPRGKDLIRILTKRCNLDSDVAQRVAACFDSDSGTYSQ